MLLLTVLSALANPLSIERGRYALANEHALEARAHALEAIAADREDWRAWHLYQSACEVASIADLCKADLQAMAQELSAVDIVNTWFDFQAELADVEDLDGTDHRELRALAMGSLHESSLPEARAVALGEAVRYAPNEVEAQSKEALSTHPDHPEIQLALWNTDDLPLEKARSRVLKAGKKLDGAPVPVLYRWLRLFEGAKERERAARVRELLVAAGEDLTREQTGPPMSLDASFAAADERIATAAAPTHRDVGLLQVRSRRRLLVGAFRQRLALHGESRNPRSRLDRVTANSLAGEAVKPKMEALACKSVREAPCAERPHLAGAYAERAQRRHAAGEHEAALVDIVVATMLQPYGPPAWYQLRAELQGDTVGGFVSRALAWELGGEEPEGGLGAGWPGPSDAGEEAAAAAIAAWTEQVGDPPGPPFDRERAERTLDTDREDHVELWRMAYLAYLDRNDAQVDQLLGRFVRRYPADPMGHVALGVTLRRRGLFTEAEAAYRTAIALEDEHAHAHEEEGERLDLSGTHVHGASEEEEITFLPPPPVAWSGLAVVLAHLERLDEARQVLAHLEAHDTSGPLIALHRGLVHEAAGERDQALEQVSLALRTRERLDPAGLKQLRIVLDEEPILEALRHTASFQELMTRSYGRTGYAPPAAPDPQPPTQ